MFFTRRELVKVPSYPQNDAVRTLNAIAMDIGSISMPLDDKKRADHLLSILTSFVMSQDHLLKIDQLNGSFTTTVDTFVERKA